MGRGGVGWDSLHSDKINLWGNHLWPVMPKDEFTVRKFFYKVCQCIRMHFKMVIVISFPWSSKTQYSLVFHSTNNLLSQRNKLASYRLVPIVICLDDSSYRHYLFCENKMVVTRTKKNILLSKIAIDYFYISGATLS